MGSCPSSSSAEQALADLEVLVTAPCPRQVADRTAALLDMLRLPSSPGPPPDPARLAKVVQACLAYGRLTPPDVLEAALLLLAARSSEAWVAQPAQGALRAAVGQPALACAAAALAAKTGYSCHTFNACGDGCPYVAAAAAAGSGRPADDGASETLACSSPTS